MAKALASIILAALVSISAYGAKPKPARQVASYRAVLGAVGPRDAVLFVPERKGRLLVVLATLPAAVHLQRHEHVALSFPAHGAADIDGQPVQILGFDKLTPPPCPAQNQSVAELR